MNAEEQPPAGTKHLQLLLGSLAEYAAKLKTACDEWAVLKSRRALTILMFLAACGILTLLLVALEATPLESRERTFAASLVAFLFLIFLFGVLYMVLSIRRRERPKRTEIEILGEQVARLIRLASQFDQHGKIEDFSEKMLLDLRLAEAEASLRYSQELSRDAAFVRWLKNK